MQAVTGHLNAVPRPREHFRLSALVARPLVSDLNVHEGHRRPIGSDLADIICCRVSLLTDVPTEPPEDCAHDPEVHPQYAYIGCAAINDQFLCHN